MKIEEHHLWHGAVLQQIAEYDDFTAINKISGSPRSAYNVNQDTALWVKYRSGPPYQFNFSVDDQREIEELYERYDGRVWIALVCGEAREICALSYYQYRGLQNAKSRAFAITVTLKPRKSFRVSAGGQRLKVTIPRSAFPRKLFGG